MTLRKDIWRTAIVEAPIAEIWARGSIAGLPRHWLPDAGRLRYLADPFGLWFEGHLIVFVEAYDHRDRHGTIEALVYDPAFRLIERRPVLVEPWHLSYPFVFRHDGQTWMLPEAASAGRLTLYRATSFPFGWEAAATIGVDASAVDATPLFLEGTWWLFYGAGPRAGGRAVELHCAYADRLEGPWHAHPANPIRRGMNGSRPGGTPSVRHGRIVLPVQDCSGTYGGAVRPLIFARLDRGVVETSLGVPLSPPRDAAPYLDGFHTLSAAGDVTLVDMKQSALSVAGLAADATRLGRRVADRWQAMRRRPDSRREADAGDARTRRLSA